MPSASKTILGCTECCALPDLGVPLIKAKVDTGAKTSALYAVQIEEFIREKEKWVRFCVLPIQKNKSIKITCEAPILTKRTVKSSSGNKEKRIVILTTLQIGQSSHHPEKKISKKIELTLSTTRQGLSYRMLLGRQALAGFLINPTKLYCQGRVKQQDIYGN